MNTVIAENDRYETIKRDLTERALFAYRDFQAACSAENVPEQVGAHSRYMAYCDALQLLTNMSYVYCYQFDDVLPIGGREVKESDKI